MKRYKAIDLFCGAGGLSLGLVKAGFNVKVAVDIDLKALRTYANNFKKVKLLNKDIKNVEGEELLKLAKIEKGSNFLLAGCPPCQGFSSIGKRDVNDYKNQLVFEYVRLIHETEPTFILMENVPGMSRGIGKDIFKEVINNLSEKYYIEAETLNAADYGVPQIRKRLVVHGIRKDVYNILKNTYPDSINYILPKKTHSIQEDKKEKLKAWITVNETISDLPIIRAGENLEDSKIFNHICRKVSEINSKRLDYIRKNGGSRKCLQEEYVLKCHKNNKASYGDTYGVMDGNRPAPTLTSGCTSITKGRYGHPTQNRGISVREAARIQTFDDNFKFVGGIDSMSLQIGNAVPPKLAQASGKSIIYLMKLYDAIIRDSLN